MMLTCQALDGFIDRLCDLTRDADPLELTAEATALIDEALTQRFVNQWRAAAAADAHYLHGVPMARIARACGKTTQAAINWVREYGPTHYVTVSREEPQAGDSGEWRYVLRTLRVQGDQPTKALIRQYRAAGRRIVPALRNLLDPSTPTGVKAGVDAGRLWDELG